MRGSSCKAVIWVSTERTSSPESAVDQVCDLWAVTRSIAALNSPNPPDLWLVTTGAHEFTGNPADPHGPYSSASQTALLGFARVIAREHPEIRCINIDLSPCPNTEEFELLERVATSNVSESRWRFEKRGVMAFASSADRQRISQRFLFETMGRTS
jgi:hypothetical protein